MKNIVDDEKKPASQAFSLVELLVCIALLSLMLVSVTLPQLYALRVTAEVNQLHQVNRALDDLAAGLAGSRDPAAFLTRWRSNLQQQVPGILIEQGTLHAHSITMHLAWPLAPGLIAIGPYYKANRLTRTVYF